MHVIAKSNCLQRVKGSRLTCSVIVFSYNLYNHLEAQKTKNRASIYSISDILIACWAMHVGFVCFIICFFF